MSRTTVVGTMKVNVDVRDVMNSYVCDKNSGGQYTDNKLALDDLGEILISLGKDRGVKIKVSIDQK